MKKRRFSSLAWAALFGACLVLAALPVAADSLQNGFRYNNFNFAPVIVTYSWSGHHPGEPDV